MRNRYIESEQFKVAISGTVGVGKSTLVAKLGEHYDNSIMYKEEIDRELLDLFYQSLNEGKSKKLELLNQFNFLSDTIKRDIKSEFDDADIQIYDRSIVEHIEIFAKANLTEENYILYDGFQDMFLRILKHPGYDLSILLVADEDENMRRINERGRESEQITDEEYFRELNRRYTSPEFLTEFERYSKETIIINTTNMTADEVMDEVTTIINKLRKEKDAK